METYHLAWLSAHPERTHQWLKDRFADGFHIHHVDGNHSNDEPTNLVLIESGDHMMLHNGSSRLLWRPPTGKKSPGRPRKVAPTRESIQAQLNSIDAGLARAAKKSARKVESPVKEIATKTVSGRESRANLYKAAAARLRFLDEQRQGR